MQPVSFKKIRKHRLAKHMEDKEERLKTKEKLLIPAQIPVQVPIFKRKPVRRRAIPRIRIPAPVRAPPKRRPSPVRSRRKRAPVRKVGDYRYSPRGGYWRRDNPFHIRFSTPTVSQSTRSFNRRRHVKSSFYTDPFMPARPYFASPTTFIKVFDEEEPTQFGKRMDKTERKRWCIKWGPPKKRGRRKGRFEIPAKRFRRLRTVSRRQDRASKLQRHFQF